MPAKPNADPKDLTIKFEISDTGKGFDESERAVMFKPFSQVDTSSTRKHGGTGLGLVLSKEFVELHGGHIQCESVKGQGSKFSFTFVARIPPPNSAARVTTPIAADESRMDGLLSTKQGAGRTPDLLSISTPKHMESKDLKGSEHAPLKHISGLKLIPGEMCFAEPDPEDARKTASEAFKMANQKIERGEYATLDATLQRTVTDDAEEDVAKAKMQNDSLPDKPTATMACTEATLDDRHNINAGLTPPQPPLGEPASVAIVAANLPNPAVDMKLAIPAKALESKRAATAAAAAAAAAATVTADPVTPLLPDRPEMPSSSNSSGSSSSTSTTQSNDSKLSESTEISSHGSLSTSGVATDVPEQPRILIIADFPHARETIVHLINQLVPKELNPLMDVAKGKEEGIEFLTGERQQTAITGMYNYVVINLAAYMSVMEVFSVLQKDDINVDRNFMTCMITTPVQRVALMEAVKYKEASMELAKSSSDECSAKVVPNKIEWVFKPLTKSKLYVAFSDVVSRYENHGEQTNCGAAVQCGSDDSCKVNVKRKTAQQVAMNQKKVFSQMQDALKGKNIRVLLAEDDMTNQRVIRRYFQKIGIELVIANDGNECLETFKSHPKGHFSLILVSIAQRNYVGDVGFLHLRVVLCQTNGYLYTEPSTLVRSLHAYKGRIRGYKGHPRLGE